MKDHKIAKKIQQAFNNPKATKKEFVAKKDQIKSYLPHDAGIQGSYTTGNIGDRAIGISIRNKLKNKGFRTRIFGKEVTRSSASNHVLGGGGVIHDWYGVDHLEKRIKFLSGINNAIIGVGVPGIESEKGKKIVREEIPTRCLLTVRDERSKKELEKVYSGEIHVTACPALTLEKPKSRSKLGTGVNFRPWFDQDPHILTDYFGYEKNIDLMKERENYIKNMKLICEDIENPIFIPFEKKDEEFAKKHLDIDILPYEFSVSTTLQRVNSINKMVATRYHSLVFAIICNKPVLSLAYAPKVTQLSKRVGVSPQLPNKDVTIQFESLSNRNKTISAAEKNFELLFKHLK